MCRLKLHRESHLVARIGWLRAAVLGANDGIVSTASLVLGVAAVITMIAVEVGLITPPLGMSPFVVKTSLDREGLAGNLSLNDIYFGALPFAAAALVVIGLIIAFPKIALILV